MADVERAVVAALEKQYADLLAPLKDLLVPKKFSLQYMQKLTRRQKPIVYSAPTQVHIFPSSFTLPLDLPDALDNITYCPYLAICIFYYMD
jgi:hypothetical protein